MNIVKNLLRKKKNWIKGDETLEKKNTKQMISNISSQGTKSVPLRAINTFPCSVCYEKKYTNSFISFVNPITDPRYCALYFSINGTVYSKACYVLPITPSMYFNISYPTVYLSDYTNKYSVRFEARGQLITFIKTLTGKIFEIVKNKLTPKEIYSAFFENSYVPKMVENLPQLSTNELFKSNLVLSRNMGKIDDPLAVSMLLQQEKSFREYIDKTIHVCTWNIDQKLPPENIMPLLGDGQSKKYEIYVFCFQEIDMSMDAIVHGDSPKKEAWDKKLTEVLQSVESYTYIGGLQLGTSYIAVFSRSPEKITNVATASIPLGSMGFFNKSAVAVRFQHHDTNLCFICSHLSHGRSNVERRNSEFWLIQNEMKFKTNDGELSVDDHDCIIWSGDFNYRLTIPDPESREKFNETDYLLKHDQLILAHKLNKVFVGYSEGKITFRPTYKFDKGTETLDTSSKQRGPAWCDRIFLRTPGVISFINLENYNSVKGMLMSDHHPVTADFHIRLWTNDSQKVEKIYQEVKSKVNLLKWKTSLSQDILDFGTVKYGEQKTITIKLKNEGQVPALFAVQCDVPWINIHPQKATVFPDKEVELVVSVLIDQSTQSHEPVNTYEFVKHVKIVYPSGKPPNYLLITGRYAICSIGFPYDYLLRLPVAMSKLPSSIFIEQVEGDLNSAPIMKYPVLPAGSYELNALMDALRSTISDPQFFFKPGESGEMLSIIEALRCRKEIKEGDYTQYSLAGVFLSILECSQKQFISPEAIRAWNEKEDQRKDAITFISSLPRDSSSTINLIVAFLIEVLKKIPELDVQKISRLFAGLFTKNDPNIIDFSAQIIESLLQ